MRNHLLALAAFVMMALSACNSDEPEASKPVYDYGDRVENVWDPTYGFVPSDYAYYPNEEKWEKLRLPDDFLASLSTMELLRVSLTFPYIYDFIFTNTVSQMQSMLEYKTTVFKGFEMLRARPDAFECLLDYYDGLISEIENLQGEHDFSIFHLPMCEFYFGSGQLCPVADLPKCERLVNLATRAIDIRARYSNYQGCISACGLYRILTVCGFDFDFGPSVHW